MALVETTRLRLRRPEAADVHPMMEMHQDPDVIRFLGSGVPGGIAVAWRNVALMIGHWEMRGYGPWIITDKTTGDILGRAGLWNAAGGPGLELGWMVRRQDWGRGIATEAAQAALRWAWTHLEDDRIIAVIHASNLPSIRIAEKLSGRLDSSQSVDGVETRTYVFSRTATG
jgi:RimJ/RimL family protein N-acetyltransferase